MQWRFAGEVPADSCVRIGRLTWKVPAGVGGDLTLDLELAAGDLRVTNHDSALVRPGTVPYGS